MFAAIFSSNYIPHQREVSKREEEKTLQIEGQDTASAHSLLFAPRQQTNAATLCTPKTVGPLKVQCFGALSD